MELVKLKPVCKSYIWGGNYFQEFGKEPSLDIISELWELSLREGNSSIIDSGENKGIPLINALTKKEIGPVSDCFEFFPILIKLIDAKENLSVQVHPSDEYALKNERSFGKSEMWHILSADEDCGLYVGLNKDYSREAIEEKLKNGNVLDCLNFFKVKPGDTFIINPGTIHAIGKGVRLIEIQQNSDLTYRLYDYKRKDKNGNERELHIDKALKVIDYNKYQGSVSDEKILADNQYFTVEKHEINGEFVLEANKDSFISFTLISGSCLANDIECRQFDTLFLPFGKKCTIRGHCNIVMSYVRRK